MREFVREKPASLRGVRLVTVPEHDGPAAHISCRALPACRGRSSLARPNPNIIQIAPEMLLHEG
jgi:hypothetical protein